MGGDVSSFPEIVHRVNGPALSRAIFIEEENHDPPKQ
jgi:hypothetical protein